MRVNEVSKRYARALYEIAKENKANDKVFSELRVLHQAIHQEASLAEFLSSPVVRPNQKIAALKTAIGNKVSSDLLNTLLVMAQKNRLNLFSELVTAYEQISDEDHDVTRGWVRSATNLSLEARKKIEETVNRVTGKKVILTFSEDKKIIGGMVAQVGGWTFDDCLDSHLKRLNEELNRRAN